MKYAFFTTSVIIKLFTWYLYIIFCLFCYLTFLPFNSVSLLLFDKILCESSWLSVFMAQFSLLAVLNDFPVRGLWYSLDFPIIGLLSTAGGCQGDLETWFCFFHMRVKREHFIGKTCKGFHGICKWCGGGWRLERLGGWLDYCWCWGFCCRN